MPGLGLPHTPFLTRLDTPLSGLWFPSSVTRGGTVSPRSREPTVKREAQRRGSGAPGNKGRSRPAWPAWALTRAAPSPGVPPPGRGT